MIAILTEKPSAAKDIARVLGVTENKKGYMEGGGYMVTWALGHLVTLAMPEDYRREKYTRDDLPILPDPFILIPRKLKTGQGYAPDQGVLSQLKTIEKIFKKCDSIINFCDAGREGELIFRFIYHYLECDKPFLRLWISSLTDAAIREGLENLRDAKDYDSLYLAAEARGKADWLTGINASRALGFCLKDNNNSLGRVQTPTLAMICKRYNEHTNFKPEPYWQMLINIAGSESFYVKGEQTYTDQAEANKIYSALKKMTQAKVIKVEKKQAKEEPPLLYDLTSLQKAANSKYGYSADTTLSAAQRLYEKKLTTYPRTGSRYIPEDVSNTIPPLMEALRADPFYNKFASGLISREKLNRKSVDATKVTDHHALLITGIMPGELSATDENVYRLIVERFLESFMPPCVKDVTTVDIDCGGIPFKARGWVIKDKGWRAVSGDEEPSGEEDNQKLPGLKEGDTLEVSNHNLIQKKTKARPLYTDGTLLAAMETAGKDLDDRQAKEALSGLGIGTPATRAAVIETLLSRGYIERQKKNLVPTARGLEIYKAVKAMRIADVEMTGQWELAIEKITKEPSYYDTFLEGMKVHARQMTDEILNMVIEGDKASASPYLCPRCKLGRMVFYQKIIRCNHPSCKHIIYRRKSEVTLSDKQLSDLLRTGNTGLIKGFINKMGNAFNAALILDSDCNLKFDFSDNYKKSDVKRKKK